MSSFTDDLEREISEDIKRDMAEREEHIRKSTSGYRIICEETEAQISTDFEDECSSLSVMVLGIIALDWCADKFPDWSGYKFTGFMILFTPAMLAQLRGHSSAGLIILLDLGGLTGLLFGLMLAGGPNESDD